MIRKPQMLFKIGGIGTDAISVLVTLLFLATVDLNPRTIVWTTLITLVTAGLIGMYRLDRSDQLIDTLFRSAFSISVGFLIAIFLFEPTPISNDVLLRIISLAFIFMATSRLIISEIEQIYYEKGLGRVPVIVIGMSRAGTAFLKRLQESDQLARIQIIGFLDNNHKESTEGIPWLGKLVDLEDIIQSRSPQAVIQVGLLEQMITVTTICQKYNLEYHVLPALIGAFGKKVSVSMDAGTPLIKVKETNLLGWGFVFKRLFDIIVSILIIILASPIWILTIITLILERKTLHIIISEPRIDGRTGKVFPMLRFITLKNDKKESYLNSDEIKLHSAGKIIDKSLKDATMLGRFLRQTEINELPQLINVLKNEMSIVGPRAPFKEELEHYTNFHAKRLRLKPGITGMWQISKEQTDGTHDALLKTDIYYVENWSLALDVKIVTETGLYALKKLMTRV